MFERVVVGVDPGTASTGLAAVVGGRRAEVRWSGIVRTSAGSPEAERLRILYRAVREAIAAHRPECVAVERLMWGRNSGSAMNVARASGVVLLAAAEAGVPVCEYAPLEVKMAVAGTGTARKEDVRRALERLHSVEGLPGQADEVDAVAVALCHLNQSRPLREAAR